MRTWMIGREPKPLAEEQYLALSLPLELSGGNLHSTLEDRLLLLGALLQNVGMDQVVHFGAFTDWEAALAARAHGRPATTDGFEDRQCSSNLDG